jgi:2-polyprenyl-3-methyl-5-hydroxy-6-metoxy-1,4-benzoquinol methylase
VNQPLQQDVYGYNRRPEVARIVPRTATSALDVGCAVGGFGESLREVLGSNARIVGIDPVEAAAEQARSAGFFDAVHTGYFPDDLPSGEGPFDLISFNDVLEHTVDPWEILSRTREHLTPDGHVLACIPNVQFAPVMWNLLRGDFTYTESGVLDRTHLRFFTRRTMIDMFESSGYEVLVSEGVNNIIREVPAFGRGHRRKLRHLLGPAQWVQYVILARASTGA